MKRTLPLIILLTGIFAAYGQPLSVSNLLTAISLSPAKGASYISQRGFFLASRDQQQDTLVETYYFKGKKNTGRDTIERKAERRVSPAGLTIIYSTGSEREYQSIIQQLKKEGFKCRNQSGSPLISQFRDLTAWSVERPEDEFRYEVRIQKKYLPAIKEILYGEDLLAFDSHEQLAYVFGEENIRNDIYYFSEKEFSRCTVLFPKTDRQAVFIWLDEVNDRCLTSLVLGGQLALESTKNYDKPIAENSWELKSKIRAGVNLKELRILNGMDFSFHSVNSKFSGMVVPGSTGKIDFQKEGIVLACMNCQDMGTVEKPLLSADEALAEGRRFFVFTIMLYPSPLASR